MMRHCLLLAAFCTFHAAPAQLLNRLKERATDAVQSAGSVGARARQSAVDRAADKATVTADRATEKQSVIFSKTPFAAGQTASTTTSFGPTDNIYARVLLPQTIYEQLAARGKEDEPQQAMSVGLLQGGQTVYCTVLIPKADYKKKYLDLDVLPAPGTGTTQYIGQGGMKDHISSIFHYFGAEAPSPSFPFGKQEFQLEFGDGLVGSFAMTVSNWKEKKLLDARLAAIVKGQSAAAAKGARLPAVFRTPGKFSDPQLSAAALKQKLGAGTVRFAVEPGSADYTIHKNALGVPEYKLTRAIWTVEKGSDGSCYYTRYYLKREYEGGGKYGPLDFVASTADKVQIACENTK